MRSTGRQVVQHCPTQAAKQRMQENKGCSLGIAVPVPVSVVVAMIDVVIAVVVVLDCFSLQQA